MFHIRATHLVPALLALAAASSPAAGHAAATVPVYLDNTANSVPVKIDGKVWVQAGQIASFELTVGKSYKLSSSIGGPVPGGVFTVDGAGEVDYDPAVDGGVLEGLGGDTIAVVSYPLTISSEDVDLGVALSGLPYMGARATKTYELPPGTAYKLASSAAGGVLPGATFTLTGDGVVEYPAEDDGVYLAGLGTDEVMLLGHDVTLDNVTNGVLPTIAGLPYPGKLATYRLPAGDYELAAAIAGGTLPGAEFSIDHEGLVRYDEDLHGVIFFGRGSDRVLPLGYPIRVELDGHGSGAKIDGTKTMIPDGSTRLYVLPVGEYELTTGDSFTVLPRGFCAGGSPSFAGGTITVHCL